MFSLAYRSTLKRGAILVSRTLVDFYQTTHYYNPQDITLQFAYKCNKTNQSVFTSGLPGYLLGTNVLCEPG
jgi:hypothetical protein